LKDWHNVKEIIRRFSTTALVYGLVSVFYNESFHGGDWSWRVFLVKGRRRIKGKEQTLSRYLRKVNLSKPVKN
jgi:hypothetical protein